MSEERKPSNSTSGRPPASTWLAESARRHAALQNRIAAASGSLPTAPVGEDTARLLSRMNAEQMAGILQPVEDLERRASEIANSLMQQGELMAYLQRPASAMASIEPMRELAEISTAISAQLDRVRLPLGWPAASPAAPAGEQPEPGIAPADWRSLIDKALAAGAKPKEVIGYAREKDSRRSREPSLEDLKAVYDTYIEFKHTKTWDWIAGKHHMSTAKLGRWLRLYEELTAKNENP